jgi:hypothetical protein
MDPGAFSVIGIDSATGAQKFSVLMPHSGFIEGGHFPGGVESLIVAGDGYAYLTFSWEEYSGASQGILHLLLLRVNSSGDYDSSEVFSVQRPFQEIGGFASSMISNNDTGILLAFQISLTANDSWRHNGE